MGIEVCKWWIQPEPEFTPPPDRPQWDGGLCSNPDIIGEDSIPDVPCRLVDQPTKSCYEPERKR